MKPCTQPTSNEALPDCGGPGVGPGARCHGVVRGDTQGRAGGHPGVTAVPSHRKFTAHRKATCDQDSSMATVLICCLIMTPHHNFILKFHFEDYFHFSKNKHNG